MSYIITTAASGGGETSIFIEDREALELRLTALQGAAQVTTIRVYELVNTLNRKTVWDSTPAPPSAGPGSTR